jgi:hypothetical protein
VTHPLFRGISDNPGLAAKVYRLEVMLERLRNPVGMLDRRPAIERAIAEDLAEIEAKVEAIATRMTSAPKKHLDGPEAWKSLAYAVVAMVRTRHALRVNAEDLKELVTEFCPPQDRASWRSRGSGEIWGLLEFEGADETVGQLVGGGTIVNSDGRKRVGAVRELIDPEGVIFWPEERDRHFRIIDTRWLHSHADMFRWVVEPWPGGRRCRFCGMEESPVVDALHPVELERRHGHTTVNGTVVLDAGASAFTHLRCREHWLRVLTTIAPYNSLAQAQAADKAAARVQTSSGLLEARERATVTGASGRP